VGCKLTDAEDADEHRAQGAKGLDLVDLGEGLTEGVDLRPHQEAMMLGDAPPERFRKRLGCGLAGRLARQASCFISRRVGISPMANCNPPEPPLPRGNDA